MLNKFYRFIFLLFIFLIVNFWITPKTIFACPSGSAECSSNGRFSIISCNPDAPACGYDFLIQTCENGCSRKYTEQLTPGKYPDRDSEISTYYCAKECGPNQGIGASTSVDKVFGVITPPSFISRFGYGAVGINKVLNTIVNLIYSVSAIIVVFLFVISAVQLILSGGDKDRVGAARKRITYAIIGVVLLSLTFVILRVLGGILGFGFFVPGA